jgi:excisionase family DNA binding protein
MARESLNERNLLTVAETAHRLRVSEETVRRRFDDGSLRGVRLGSVRRILANEIDRLLDDSAHAGEEMSHR